MRMKRMDPYRETRSVLFRLDDDQNFLSDLTSLLLATIPVFCASSEKSVDKRGPCLSAGISRNEGTTASRSYGGQGEGQGRGKGCEECYDFRGKLETAGL